MIYQANSHASDPYIVANTITANNTGEKIFRLQYL
jgi:hypothetical protein